ncbi:DNA-binding transcriptional regulator, AcrR family [Tenacibaculum sp. MAR_2009_124]|uniref:TetR/AcrR family transcriptional regulator n=1 Tax=Tenacibaculum sp. MAR_2009_124 TaxID=1250059 RepID=UPI00089CCE96|nr:TetR/AcrR family transcriptional regulator [Tenacibaculum sp. MAR_2009_124]SEC51853.1 DNA-binding transcriptional regulator, AcrR family [Tenacibaculum sp. MAR_2009_124]
MSLSRERILETASYLIHHQGYNSTGINQIIKEAKVAKSTFYQHFESKDLLCVEFLNRRHNFWFSEFSNFTSQFTSLKEKTLAAFDFIMIMNKNENFRGCSFLNILSEISEEQKSIRSVIQVHKNDLRQFFQELIEEELLATHVYMLFESSIIESQLFKSNEIVEKSKKIIKTLL